MDEGRRRLDAARERRRKNFLERPDRVALWAFMLAVAVMIAAAASAHAATGGVASGGSGSGGAGSGGGTVAGSRYVQAWESFPRAERRWAHRTSDCESGGDPRAIGGGGRYRGAFQFTRPTWSNAPRSPGGDPISYSWVTQAVVAVLLKHHVGTSPWPKCG